MNSNLSSNVSNQKEASQIPRVEVANINYSLLSNLGLNYLEGASTGFDAENLIQVHDVPETTSSYNSARQFSMGLRMGALLYLPAQEMGYSGGFTLAYKLNRKLSLESGASYQVRRDAFASTEQASAIQYSFGANEINYSLRPTAMHHVEVPLLLKFTFGVPKNLNMHSPASKRYMKHNLSLGASLGLWSGVEAEISEQLNELPSTSFEKGWISEEFINNTNQFILMGYDYNLSKAITLGIRGRYQINDTFKDNVLNKEALEPNKWFVEFGLGLKLF